MRVNGKGLLVGRAGAGKIARFLQQVADFAKHLRIVGLKSEGRAERLNRFGQARFFLAEQRHIGVKRSAIFKLKRALETTIRVGKIIESREGEAKGVVIVGLVRRERDSFEQKISGAVVVRTLVFEATEEIKGAGMGRLFFQEFTVVFGGFREIAGAVLLVRAFEQWMVGHKR